jgi:haloalkane dehalogenase
LPPAGSFVERFIERDGMKIYCRDYAGPEPALVLMHGFPDHLEIYNFMIPHLVGQRRIVTFDFIGWGRSDRPAGYKHTFEALVEDLRAVIDALGLERPVLVGHDSSGPPAIEWALAHPERTGHLVLLNTFYMMMLTLRPPEGVFLYMMPLLKYLMNALNELTFRKMNGLIYGWQLRRFLFHREKHPFIDHLQERWEETWPAFRDIVGRLFFRSIRYAFPKNMARVRRYQGGVRVIFGARDPYLNVSVAQRFHREFAGSDLFILRRASHYVQIDQPEEVSRLVLEVASRVPVAEPERIPARAAVS